MFLVVSYAGGPQEIKATSLLTGITHEGVKSRFPHFVHLFSCSHVATKDTFYVMTKFYTYCILREGGNKGI